MSAGIMPDNIPLGTEASEEDDYQYLREAIDANLDLDFYIFAASVGPEDAAGMRTLMRYLTDQKDVFRMERIRQSIISIIPALTSVTTCFICHITCTRQKTFYSTLTVNVKL